MRIGILTGSGTYSLPDFEGAEVTEVETRFGTARVSAGRFGGADVVHVARHGEGHRWISSLVDHRTNITALQAAGADALLAVTVCGSLDPALELGTLLVFDDLHFLDNRLGDGSLCTLYDEPGMQGRGHWIFDRPFSPALRAALLAGARDAGRPVRDGGCYGHVNGPRFNTRSEIRALQGAGVTAVSQTAGPEAVLAGEAGLPYALVGYATDYANGVSPEPTPVDTLIELIGASTATFGSTLAAAVAHVRADDLAAVGTHFRFE